MKIIVDEAGEIIAKATDDHTLIGGHHRLAVAASLGKRLFWRDTGEPYAGRRTCRDSLTMSVHGGIVLQKSQKALRLIFRQRTKQAIVADQCGLKPATGVACEFGA